MAPRAIKLVKWNGHYYEMGGLVLVDNVEIMSIELSITADPSIRMYSPSVAYYMVC